MTNFISALNIKVAECNLKLYSASDISDLNVVICHANTLINVCNISLTKCNLSELLKVYDFITDLKVIIMSADLNKTTLINLKEVD